MDPPHKHVLAIILCILLYSISRDISIGLRCTVVDFERPATVSITQNASDGSEISGYVEVRKGIYLFWSYYKSPDHESSPEKPWPTIFYAAPNASSRVGNFNSLWLHTADLLVVDTPVGTGYSYEDHISSGDGVWSWMETIFPLLRRAFMQAAADILVLLRALTSEVATLQSSPLILLNSAYGGTYVARIGTVVGIAIRTGALNNLTVAFGGLAERFDGRTTPEENQISVETR